MKEYKPLKWPRFWPFLRVVDELPATKRGKRKASNYGVSIVIRRDVLKNEPHVLQQEIFESRYWLRHPWRLVDFFWFYARLPRWWAMRKPHYHKRFVKFVIRYERAAAHLSSVECRSRAHEIRALLHGLSVNFDNSQRTAEFWAREYAITIYRASNYPYIMAAGWTEGDCYNEIIKHL